MKKFTVKHTFNTDLDTYWSKIFFDAEYNTRLYKEVLQFPTFEILELKEQPDGSRIRRLKIEPKADIPGPVKKIFGDAIIYLESGRFDPAAKRWTYKVETTKMADKINIGGEFWAEPRGEKKIERICQVSCDVSIFGIGGLVEGVIEKTTLDSYEKAYAFTNKFIAEKGY